MAFAIRILSGMNKVNMNQRTIFGWLNLVWNRVDSSRIKDIGADKACAEWLLRCGAHVKWCNRPTWTTDYNSLPTGSREELKIEEIHAEESCIMGVGFEYLKNLDYVRKITFRHCIYLDDDALKKLCFVKESLNELKIISCGGITDFGVLSLTELKNLVSLELYDLPSVDNRRNCLESLTINLPGTKINFPYAQVDDADPPEAV